MFYYVSKNQVLYGLHDDIMKKSCEQRLITKDHIATHTYLYFMFKPALRNFVNVAES